MVEKSLLNLAMVNAYVLYKEWSEKMNKQRQKQLSHTDFRINVLKKWIATVTEHRNALHDTEEVCEFSRLGGRHFMERIPLGEDGKQKSCLCKVCKVCNKAGKLIHARSGAPPKKKYGSVTIYQYKQCKVELWAKG